MNININCMVLDIRLVEYLLQFFRQFLEINLILEKTFFPMISRIELEKKIVDVFFFVFFLLIWSVIKWHTEQSVQTIEVLLLFVFESLLVCSWVIVEVVLKM